MGPTAENELTSEAPEGMQDHRATSHILTPIFDEI
jgi:hypothetical protein